MLTKNFYSYMRAVFQKTSATFTKPNGNTVNTSIVDDKPPFTIMKSWSGQANYYGVTFGTGTTPATASDYALENILGPEKIGVANPSAVSFSQGDTYDEYTVTFGITNKTAAAITISEVGLTAAPYCGSSSNHYALVDRTVLDEPITIPAGQSKQITYTIRFNY